MKDAYYFSHDANAKDDPKCVMLIEQLGLEGYGIYWVLIETLRDQPDYKYPIILIPALARRYNTTAEKVRSVINSYGLFVVDEDNFFSLSLIERMKKFEHKREVARLAGKKSAEKRLLNSGSTSVQQELNERSSRVQPNKVKESKVKEIKEKKKEYADNITLTLSEYQKLVDKYGEDQTRWMIEKLDIWKGSTGKRTKSDYLTILKWVVKAYEEDQQSKSKFSSTWQQPKKIDPDPDCPICNGTGKRVYGPADNPDMKVTATCQCVSRKAV